MSIRILDPAVRQRIAAGEVIERPASLVKELIENAVDAGALAVDVEVRGAGMEMIRVSDDGCGMSRADAQLCTERFSTSKVRSLDDLRAIRTLGFRGEALSSIAAVAETEILTRTADEVEGTRVGVDGDQVSVEPAASPVGTSVTARHLFARLPARRRFLKSRTRETELVHRTVSSFALAYPQTAFRLTVDGRERLVAPRSAGLPRIGAVLGRHIADEMVAIEWAALDLQVTGFVSSPAIGRNRRDGQYTFANGRPVQPGLLAVMLERPYAGRLPPGRHPVAVLHITVDPHYVDVNVHPRKAEVRFAHERTVYGAVISAVSEALEPFPRSTDIGGTVWPFYGWAQGQPSDVSESATPYEPTRLRALAQLHFAYVLAQAPEGLVIADQHAAHEQVLYEQLARGCEPVTLSPPVRVSLTPAEMNTLEGIAPSLKELGMQIEPFGGRALLVRALPSPLSGQDPGLLLSHLIEDAARQRGSIQDLQERLATRMACLAAVKAGDPLTVDQMQDLLDKLSWAWTPATCPHGRPAIVTVSLDELAARFGRQTT